jgi:hypothetical protein
VGSTTAFSAVLSFTAPNCCTPHRHQEAPMSTLHAVDHVRLIYACPDATAGIYDGGIPLAHEGDVDDLTVGVTRPGCYRSDTVRGLIQVALAPVFGLTNKPPTANTPDHELAGMALAARYGYATF